MFSLYFGWIIDLQIPILLFSSQQLFTALQDWSGILKWRFEFTALHFSSKSSLYFTWHRSSFVVSEKQSPSIIKIKKALNVLIWLLKNYLVYIYLLNIDKIIFFKAVYEVWIDYKINIFFELFN